MLPHKIEDERMSRVSWPHLKIPWAELDTTQHDLGQFNPGSILYLRRRDRLPVGTPMVFQVGRVGVYHGGAAALLFCLTPAPA